MDGSITPVGRPKDTSTTSNLKSQERNITREGFGTIPEIFTQGASLRIRGFVCLGLCRDLESLVQEFPYNTVVAENYSGSKGLSC